MAKILKQDQDYLPDHIVEVAHIFDDKLELTSLVVSEKEDTINKALDIESNKTSNTFFPTVKAVYNWAVGLFVKGTAYSTDNAIARFDGTTGKLVQDSGVTISDEGIITANNGIRSFFNRTPVLNGALEQGNFAGEDTYTTIITDLNSLIDAGIWNISNTGNVANMPYNFMGWGYVMNMRHSNIADNGNWATQFFVTMTTAKTIIYARQLYSGSWQPWQSLNLEGTSFIDNVGSSGTDGQVLKKVDGLVLWSNP